MALTKVPAHMTDGLAKSDLSNVNAATGRGEVGRDDSADLGVPDLAQDIRHRLGRDEGRRPGSRRRASMPGPCQTWLSNGACAG